MVALVTGAASGLGALIADALEEQGQEVVRWDRNFSGDMDVRCPEWGERFLPEHLDVLVNCAGINRIAWLDGVGPELWEKTLATNAEGILRMFQLCSSRLHASKGTVLNIVSNAAHMPMRCSAAYNASKAAAWILTKQMARELAPDITVFSVSPNKLAGTGMSEDIDRQVMETRGWTAEQARDYQLAGLLTGQETPPERVAEFIAFLLQSKEHHRYLTGCDIPYGA
jgi:NAD(P)-dependent dehydrogenase (short-subunit alcohol dehydrogenase family)